jgi:hypothetical protein
VQEPPDSEDWLAIRDRLRRAAVEAPVNDMIGGTARPGGA